MQVPGLGVVQAERRGGRQEHGVLKAYPRGRESRAWPERRLGMRIHAQTMQGLAGESEAFFIFRATGNS